MEEMNFAEVMNNLINFSEQELDTISKKIYRIRADRRTAKLNELKTNFEKAWYDLEKEGVDICFDGDAISFKCITFDD